MSFTAAGTMFTPAPAPQVVGFGAPSRLGLGYAKVGRELFPVNTEKLTDIRKANLKKNN